MAPVNSDAQVPESALTSFHYKLTSATEQAAEAGIRHLLRWVGEDPDREGLRDTPERVVRSYAEMTRGYQEDPGEILSKVFQELSDEMIVLRNIHFTSLCEHHLMAFTGEAAVGYIPSDVGVVGLSKLARLVECFARRLQIQERLTRQIAEALQEHLRPRATGVVIRAHHHCMSCRGVEQPDAEMVTVATFGAFRDITQIRDEFMRLAVGTV